MTVNGVPVRVREQILPHPIAAQAEPPNPGAATICRARGGVPEPTAMPLAAAIGVARQGTQAPPISLASVHNVSAAVAATLRCLKGTFCSGKGYLMSQTGKTLGAKPLGAKALGGKPLGGKTLGRGKTLTGKPHRQVLGLALAGCASVLPAAAAEREQVRMVINLVAGVKMPFPGNVCAQQYRAHRTRSARHQRRHRRLPPP